MSLFEDFGIAIIPKRVRPHIREYLFKAGIIQEPYAFFGQLFFFSLALGVSAFYFFFYEWIFENSLFVAFFLTFAIVAGLMFSVVLVTVGVLYFYLEVVIYQRMTQIELVLPDYLQLVASNVKSGIPFENSLWYAIKPRFGILAFEMQIVLKKVMTGHELTKALAEFSQKYNSPMLRRAMSLLIGELETGGKISSILDDLVVNIRQNHKLKAEMAASVITYMIFIGVIIIVIAPGLFALSYELLNFMKKFLVQLAASGASSTVISVDPTRIDMDLFGNFSLLALSVISFLSSIIVSIIEKGNVKGGIKYVPIFMIGCLFFYFLFRIILAAIFKGINL